MPNVFIVGHSINSITNYSIMFKERGYNIVSDLNKADLVQFTGGSDVNPMLYGEDRHRTTHFDAHRDTMERERFIDANNIGIPMAGICRGGQFLNVMNGGKLYQDVDNHACYDGHLVVDIVTAEVVHVSSTHHQMMRPSSNAIIIGITEGLANIKRNMNKYGNEHIELDDKKDIEVVFYPDTKSLCFQPHPELPGYEECNNYYFELISRYFNIKG